MEKLRAHRKSAAHGGAAGGDEYVEVIVAESLGMCFGVRDALAAAREIDEPAEVTIFGELVHNEAVRAELNQRGFLETPEGGAGDVPSTPQVLVTAHGVSDRVRARFEEAGKQVVDTTCPLVRRAHEAARSLAAAGCHVLVIGRRDHVEVRGLVGDLESAEVIESIDEVRAWPCDEIGIIAQTTTPTATAEAIRSEVVARNPQARIRWIDTICQPTKDRQVALDALISRVDAVVVVGGSNSNNTKKLASRCRERGVPAYHIQGARDLQPNWFHGCRCVGLTAGTSTLDSTIAEVYRELCAIA